MQYNTIHSVEAENNKTKKEDVEDLQPKTLPPFSPVNYPSNHQPAILHAYFDPNREIIDPVRSLTDIPEPAPRQFKRLKRLLDQHPSHIKQTEMHLKNQLVEQQKSQCNSSKKQPNYKIIRKNKPSIYQQYLTEVIADSQPKDEQKDITYFDENSSKWELIQSPALTDYLSLLEAGRLIKLPRNFYYNTNSQPLLSSINQLSLIDMNELGLIIKQLSNQDIQLTRHGFINLTEDNQQSQSIENLYSHHLADIRQAHEWEAILYPHRYEQGLGNLETDILATSIAIHALSQCATRKTINYRLTAEQIVHYLRSYVLSQVTLLPHKCEQLKTIGIYEGHIIAAAYSLGWNIEKTEENAIVFNVSSRSGLFNRYPLLSDYYINGWE